VTPPVAIIDTNVVVNGLIVGERGSPPAVILDAMIGARFTYLLSVDLLAEYREVLLRAAIRQRHGFTDAGVEVLLTELALNGTLCDPRSSSEALPDAEDRLLWALLEDEGGAVLVTGDDALRRRAPEPARVLSPRQFIGLLPRVPRGGGPRR
jgi:uncharacterized protein